MEFKKANVIKSLLSRHLPEHANIVIDSDDGETKWLVYYPLMFKGGSGKLTLQPACVFTLTMEHGVKVCRPYHFNKEYQRKAQELDDWHDDILELLALSMRST
jgi:hypothetical protein